MIGESLKKLRLLEAETLLTMCDVAKESPQTFLALYGVDMATARSIAEIDRMMVISFVQSENRKPILNFSAKDAYLNDFIKSLSPTAQNGSLLMSLERM